MGGNEQDGAAIGGHDRAEDCSSKNEANGPGIDDSTQSEQGSRGGVPVPSTAGTTHARKVSAAPNLSLDTRAATPEIPSGAAGARKPTLSPGPLNRSVSIASRTSPVTSPELSPRTRGRGFSLRRSLLARNIQTPAENRGSAIELQEAGSSRTPGKTQHLRTKSTTSKKPSIAVTVSPIVQPPSDDSYTPSQVTRKTDGSFSLPNYERWLKKRKARSGLSKRLMTIKENVRKTILGIHDLPASKDGRHLDLDPSRRKPLIDERRGHEYIDNTIRSCRYSLWNFLPRQLFAQFSKLANFYFLCVSILQMIPGLSTTGTYTTIVPLLFFVTVSMAKEGYDDLRRYRLDKAENMKEASVLNVFGSGVVSSNNSNEPRPMANCHKPWTQKKWKDVRVGDVVKLGRDEACSADMVLLQAKGTEGAAYVETMALDGETNLKSKRPAPPLAKTCGSLDGIIRCDAHLVVEDPNLDLYRFDGKITAGEETLPLTNNEVIYRGSMLRNTTEVIGVIIYSGEECKIRMNAIKNPRIKAPALQTVVNNVVIIIVIFVIVLAVFNTVAYQVWRESYEEDAWYLEQATVAFFPILTSFIILFNTMIPLSLYVSLEIVKLFQMMLMNDFELYDLDSNTPLEARTSTINEELGQVNYIFSDKTGTLTNNSMRFRKISVAGTAWLHDPDLQEEAIKQPARLSEVLDNKSKGKKPVRRKTSSSTRFATPHDPLSPTLYSSPTVRKSPSALPWKSSARPQGAPQVLGTAELICYVQHRPHTIFARKVRFFLLSLSLCHTCFPEHDANGKIEYQAASPDEQALVRAAHELGYVVVDRQSGTITIKTFPSGQESEPSLDTYQILDVIEFSSARKRMSIIVRMPNHRICVFCKGADSTIMQLLRLSGLALAKSVEIEQRVSKRRSLEAQEAIRRNSEAQSRKNSMTIGGLSIGRPSLGGIGRPSLSIKRLQPIRDEVDHWLRERETDVDMSPRDSESFYYSPKPSAHFGGILRRSSLDRRRSMQEDGVDNIVEEAMIVDDTVVFERCFQHINDFATEGLRTLLYGYRYMEENEYESWKKLYLDASTSLVDRQEKMDSAGAIIEQNLELAGATAIEDKLQDGVSDAIDRLRRAKIKLWMLTGDKRETAINIGHSCRLIKDYSSITVLDSEAGDVSQRIAAATLEVNTASIAHSVVVVDGKTLGHVYSSEPLRELFVSLAILVDTVICCRASPSQKASLVHSIRSKVNRAITLAIGDGANDIAMIQEAHVGIGITGKEGLQAARCSDYSIAQFRFLTKLLLVHGRWNYIRTCKYTLGTFWKEMLFYLTQALYQRYAGYTGTSLYESWSLSMFNTLFTSLPVILMGIFEQDLSASTLMAVPELYHSLGPQNAGFNIPLYLGWVAMAASNAVIIFFIMLGLFGQSLFTDGKDLFAMGALTFTACIIVIASKIQFWELQNKTYTCVIAMLLSIGGWFSWNLILSSVYTNNVIYDVRDGFTQRFGRSALWWLTLILCVAACWVLEICVKTVKNTWFPSDADSFRELEKDDAIKMRFEEAAGMSNGYMAGYMPGKDSIEPSRTAEEDRRREGEVQELLDRPRHMRSTSGTDEQEGEPVGQIRRRQTSETAETSREHTVSFAEDVRHNVNHDEKEDTQGKDKSKRRSTDVQELLRRGFGNVRRSLDMV